MNLSTALLFAFSANATAWLVGVFYAFRVKQVPVYHPLSIFLGYFLLGYVYRPAVDWLYGGAHLWTGVHFTPTPGDVIYATFVDVIGFTSFFFIPPLLVRGIHDNLAMPKLSLRIARKITFYLGAAIILAIGAYSFSKGIASGADQLSNIVVQVTADGGQAIVNGSGYQTIGMQFIPALLIILYLRSGFSWLNIIFTLFYVLLRMYWGEERSGFVSILIAAVVVFMIRKRELRIRIAHVMIALALLAMVDFIGNDRLVIRELVAGRISAAYAYDSFVYNRTSANDAPGTDLEEFESMTIVTSIVPDMTGGYNWLTQYASLLVRPIPRQWWPDKPVNTANVVMAKYGNFFDLTFSMMGDAYSNFGLPSVILVTLLDGILVCSLYKKTQKTRSPYLLFFFVVTTANLPLLYRDGGWMGSLYYVLAGFMGAAFLIFLGGLTVIREVGAIRNTFRRQSVHLPRLFAAPRPRIT